MEWPLPSTHSKKKPPPPEGSRGMVPKVGGLFFFPLH
jgi:hypothetical protein